MSAEHKRVKGAPAVGYSCRPGVRSAARCGLCAITIPCPSAAHAHVPTPAPLTSDSPQLKHPCNRRCWSARASGGPRPSRCRPRPPSWLGATSSASPSPAQVCRVSTVWVSRLCSKGAALLAASASQVLAVLATRKETAVPAGFCSAATTVHPSALAPCRQDAGVLAAHDHGGAAGGGEREVAISTCWAARMLHAAFCVAAAGWRARAQNRSQASVRIASEAKLHLTPARLRPTNPPPAGAHAAAAGRRPGGPHHVPLPRAGPPDVRHCAGVHRRAESRCAG